jgi:hypothetical protein
MANGEWLKGGFFSRPFCFVHAHSPSSRRSQSMRRNKREGFVFEKEAVEPMNGFMMKYYRWTRNGE